MSVRQIFLILLLFLQICYSASPEPQPLPLNDNKLDKDLSHYKYVFVLFRSKHPICNNLSEGFHNISETLSQLKNTKLRVVSFEESPAVFSKYQITSVPQILLFKDGRRVEECSYNDVFNESREYLQEWVLEKFLLELPRVGEIVGGNVTKVVSVGCKREDELLKLMMTDNHNDYYCTDQPVGGYSLGDILLVTRNETLKYDPATYGDIYTWVKTFEDGYVKPLDDYSTHHMLNDNIPLFILLTHLDDESNNILPVYHEISRRLASPSLRFIHSNIKDNLQQQVETLNFIGHSSEYPYPHLSYLTFGDNMIKYHPEKITSENITQWVESALAGKERPYVKNVDHEEKDGPSVFSSIGYNKLLKIKGEYPFFVYFYSEYCEECVLRLADMKTELSINKSQARHYFKYSITDNDVPSFINIESVPTLVLFDSDMTILHEEHSVDNMKRFIQSNSGVLATQKHPTEGKSELVVESEEGRKEAEGSKGQL